jgi:hypothetical protein
MLHRIVKILSAYVRSVNDRKRLDLDSLNFTVEIIITARQANGEFASVNNHINVVDALPSTYSEIVRNAAGQTTDFVAGARGNKRKAEVDNLVKSFEEVKTALASSELAKAMETIEEVFSMPLEAVMPIVKAKKTRVKKSEQVSNEERA